MGVHRSLAIVVPYVEVVIGVLLATQLVRPWPAVMASGLLIAFTVLIVLRLRDGSRPPCACFGARSKRPLSSRHVLRNLGLLTLSLTAVALS
jgi:hypothetical protein